MPEKPGFLESFSPWTSRSNTPKPTEEAETSKSHTQVEKLAQRQTKDHATSTRHRISPRDYPSDCPKSKIRWFYAVDAPKRKPLILDGPPKESKPLPAPKKYAAFSQRDSRSIEKAFERLAETGNIQSQTRAKFENEGDDSRARVSGRELIECENTIEKRDAKSGTRVPVNEDYLFDVDVDERELAPAYWLGPIYDVRRGSWFYQEGSSLRPCDENLATQLEEGYVKVRPWRNPSPDVVSAGGETKSEVSEALKLEGLPDEPNNPGENDSKGDVSIPAKFELQTHRLFGSYINSVVTYQDADTAWILTDDFLSRMSSTVYQRFAGGGHLGGVKVIRGYRESIKMKGSEKTSDAASSSKISGDPSDNVKAVPAGSQPGNDLQKEDESEPRLLQLERQMSNFVSSPTEDLAKQEAEARQRDEDEIRADYADADGQEQGREIEHLILVTHGIGQRLGLRMESINFIHDVNVLRKTLKSVYDNSPDLQALNNEVEKLPKNCRVQVLPVVWRHLLDFPKKSFKQNREQDLADVDEEEEYPSLDSITVDGVPAIRQLISDLALDILLYQSAYREHIVSIVRRECNRVYDLFMSRNPQFDGKVSIVGHSLGSAILFDILCQQQDVAQNQDSKVAGSRRHSRQTSHNINSSLKFKVEDFYCLGSPLGLYQMLKGHLIRARTTTSALPKTNALEDPFLGPASSKSQERVYDILSVGISSPKCGQLFNIFHPADPIAYRVEPLVSSAMSSLKPQPLPYTKKGIFGMQGQGFSNIGARVGQSVSGMWSNLTSGVASSLLNRSLGLTADSPPPRIQNKKDASLSVGAGTNVTAGTVGEDDSGEDHPPTLLDSEKVTLYAEFEKQRKSLQSDGSRDLGERFEWAEAERRSKKLRTEEAKVRALNSNGRIDFSIQEGVFDISLIASIASHLSYWADEDVNIMNLLEQQGATLALCAA